MPHVDGATVAEVTSVLNSAMQAMDDGDGAAFASAFTQDGTLTVRVSGARACGPAQLAAFCRGLKQRFPGTMHVEANVVVTAIDGETGLKEPPSGARVVRNRSYWFALAAGGVSSCGEHRDVLVQASADQPWRIASRLITHSFVNAAKL